MLIQLISPRMDAEVCLQTETQQTFASEEERRAGMDGSLTFRWYDLERKGEDHTVPLPVSFVWEETGGEETAENAYSYLLLSEREDMSAPWVYITKDSAQDVYNLKIGTEYFWCVQKNGKRSGVSRFRTRRTLPRCLKIDPISNVRDMGGYDVEGGRIRQGLVYRGGEFELHMQLDPSGAQELRRLGIRTELDMRGEAAGQVDRTTGECLGMNRVFVPSVPYGDVFGRRQRTALRKFFRVFAGAKNYPVYYHCWGGADRTGTAAFILGAFLGMRLEDLLYEYEFTSLSVWGIRSRNYDGFRQFLQQFTALPGDSLQEKGRYFLREYAALTDKQLAAIYDILVERDGTAPHKL